MPRKKKQETPEQMPEAQIEDPMQIPDPVVADYRSLTARLAEEERRVDAWEKLMQHPDLLSLLDDFLTEEDQLRESLVECKPKDLVRLQERVKARKEIVERMGRNGRCELLVDLRRQLDQFKSDNALFVSALEEMDKEAAPAEAGATS